MSPMVVVDSPYRIARPVSFLYKQIRFPEENKDTGHKRIERMIISDPVHESL
jgi:hypothetical protein